MSDPMTNSEVEDVLSSIRRLVSDEKRPEAPEAEPRKPFADKLVLTPSLRVPQGKAQAPTPPLSDDAKIQKMPDALSGQGEAPSAAPDLDAPTPLVLANTGHEAVDTPQAEDDVGPAGDAASEDPDVEAPDDSGPEPLLLQEGFSDDEPYTPETLGAKIAALETLIAGRSDEWEPDQAGASAYAGTEPPAMAWEDTEDETIDEDIVAELDNASDFDQVAEDAEDLHRPAENADPEVETETMPAQPEASTRQQPDRAQTLAADSDILDEDALRELVSDIVREELQGALGERITRNVRKLVRRELHRALAAQDFE